MSITAGVDKIMVLQCPSCKETINTSVSQCPYCATPIDPVVAETAALHMARLNQACSDASYLRITAGTMVTFVVMRFLPIVGTVGAWGYLFLLIAIPVLAIRWWVRFGSLKSDDPDFLRAKRSILAATGIWGLLAGLWILFAVLAQL